MQFAQKLHSIEEMEKNRIAFYKRFGMPIEEDKMDKYQKRIAKLPKHKCKQCGKDMGFEYFLGAVCGSCCRENHRKAMGK